MAPETIFVNVGRGASVATNDLITALNNKTIAFAALDVFEEEPLPEDSPLWEMQNVLLTPHISGMTPKFKSKLLAIFIPNLNQFVTDQTLVKNQVSLKKAINSKRPSTIFQVIAWLKAFFAFFTR